jgi:class 3 adenylate cyclase/predicted ATPase
MDVASWLRSLGLEQYEAVFRDNAIDDSVLPDLSDQDLEKLGVLLGHRRKLLRAIANIEATAQIASRAVGATVAVDVSPRDTAERRQVTVMFSDLGGSTALSARMDPEDLREVISAYHKCVAETVQRFGGFVAKYMGDGVLVYFGYPQAHEDDAERAVRAGLELVAVVGALKTHAPLQTRVGIATGLVVVGDLIGSGASREQAIVGETPNLAARLQGIGEPSSVVIAESTRKLLGNLFELEDLGAKDLKGIAGPVRAWTALRPGSVEGRFEAFHASGLTELVGREEELDLLLRRWSKAKTGEGQVVLLSGEAGIGKSRLTAALLERLAAEPHTRLRYFCSPQRTDSALYPIISQMERAAGFAHEDNTQAKLDKLDALLAKSLTPAQDAALLADMLSLANDGRYPQLELAPPQRRQKTFYALDAQLEALARQRPVLMVVEDVHWADPTSLVAFGRAVDRMPTHRVLLAVTFRPDFSPPWIGQPHVTALTLNRLTGHDVEMMIDRVASNQRLPANIRQDIVERTDGIPLFVEEMTKAVLESGSETAAAQAVAMAPSPAAAVPSSLHASLLARLDRLGPAKEIAQIGSTIGREFSHALLSAVAGKPEQQLASALDRLVAAGLLLRKGLSPHATYLFKHALVQDAAYGTLLREPRRALHARIADTLESQFADVAENQPDLLARHCIEASQIERAVELRGKAGQRSLERSALIEAFTQFKQALDLIARLPATTALRRQQIKLQVALINPVIHIKGYGAPETKEAIERAHALIQRAEELGEAPDDPLLLFSVLHGFWLAAYVNFNGNRVRDLAAQFQALAERQQAIVPRMIAHRTMGISLLESGEFAQSREQFDRAFALYNPVVHRPVAYRFSNDSKVMILAYRARALWLLGYPAVALLEAQEALAYAREIGQASAVMFALLANSSQSRLRGDLAASQTTIDELGALAGEKAASFFKAMVVLLRGTVLVQTGRQAEAIEMINSGLVALQSTGSRVGIPIYLSSLALAHAHLYHTADASRYIEDALAAVEASGERWYEAEVHRLAGEIALKLRQREKSEAYAYFSRALAVARLQKAKSWELRAAMSLARLWRDQGKPQQAHELLAPVYGWFTEGFETRDLKEAKAMLEELAV